MNAFAIGDIVTATTDVTGRARNITGEILFVSSSGWGDTRYDVASADGVHRFSERQVTLDPASTADAGMTEIEKFLALAA